MTRFLRVTVPLLASCAAASAATAAPLLCTPGREGAVACLDGKLCECRHDPGGSLTGRQAGMRWHCGALRPSCGTAAVPPADTGQSQPPPPLLPMPLPPNDWR